MLPLFSCTITYLADTMIHNTFLIVPEFRFRIENNRFWAGEIFIRRPRCEDRGTPGHDRLVTREV